jgi:hypothetical protein
MNGNGNADKLDARAMRTLRTLAKNVDKYSTILRKKLRTAGVKPTPAKIFFASMYYETLDRLAKE